MSIVCGSIFRVVADWDALLYACNCMKDNKEHPQDYAKLTEWIKHYTISPLRVRHAVKTLERDGLFGYSCGMDYIVIGRVNP